jgi:uncharacterized protein YdhG (YjbR/CyaY superfamily)
MKDKPDSSTEVTAYIKSAPRPAREKLIRLRALIRSTAPDATERFSYGMPYYSYRGRLAYFGLWKKHIGLYIPPPIIAQHKQELKSYETSKSAVRLPLDDKLPEKLIRQLIRARMAFNENRAALKQSR